VHTFLKAFQIFALTWTVLLWSLSTFAVEDPKAAIVEVGIKTVLGAKVDLSLQFLETDGREVALKDVFVPGKPAILVPAYFSCPRLCGLTMHGVAKAISEMTLSLNKDYRIITVSFNHAETPTLAADKGKEQRALLPSEHDGEGWRFLVGQEANVKALMQQVGFGFMKDGDEFAHSSAIMILTPGGEISQYFTGIDFSPFDLKLSLIEAAQGGIGTPLDHLFLFCLKFDDKTGKYTWAAFNLMRIGAGITLSLLVGLILTLWWRDRASDRAKREKPLGA